MSGQTQSPAPRRWRMPAFIALIVAVSAFAGVIGAHAFAHRQGAMGGGPLGMIGGPGGPMMMGPPADAEEAADRAAWMVRRFVRHVNANAEQKAKLIAIATAAAKDTFAMREKMTGMRRAALDLLRQPTVGRDKIEALRAEQMAAVDALSKRLAQAVGDAAEVLTPDQRKDLADDLSFMARHAHGPRE